MSYIEFDKEKLVNVNYSKSREILRCSRTGSFATTTLLGMNTRKYHGLFIVPQDQLDGERYLLLSNLNETLVVNDMEFHIGVNQYKGGVISPKGHKYLQKFVIICQHIIIEWENLTLRKSFYFSLMRID